MQSVHSHNLSCNPCSHLTEACEWKKFRCSNVNDSFNCRPRFDRHWYNSSSWKLILFLSCLVNGSYGNWSLNSRCNVSCGEGFETWSRECNNPAPKYGGRNCRRLGEVVEYRPCTKKPCPCKSTIAFLIRVCVHRFWSTVLPW